MRKSFFVFAFVFPFLFSCKDEEKTNIPDARVSINLTLSNYATFANSIGSYLVCPADLLAKDRIGLYGYGGIILFHTMDMERPFVAYDRTCPFEVKSSIKINVDKDGKGICPQCGSQFDLLNGYGNVLSGKAAYPLRSYTVRTYVSSVYGEELYVTD